MLRAARSVVRMHGIAAAARLAVRRAVGARARCYPLVRGLVSSRVGLEIGGPSPIFSRRGLLPVYPVAERVDNCNFQSTTVWEGAITGGRTFVFDPRRAPGTQYFAEATHLAPIAAHAYDFVLSSHTLEHTANPLKALRECERVLKNEGILVLVLPHKQGTFDHRRPVTAMAHLIADLAGDAAEDDTTHVAEVLELHDVSRDPGVERREDFRERCLVNVKNRCLHHHVFDTALVAEMIDWLGWHILAIEPAIPHHVILVGRKGRPSSGANAAMMGPGAVYRQRSPFRMDRGKG